MDKVKIKETTAITIKRICCFIGRKVTKFVSGAKVDYPMKFFGRKIYLIVTKDRNSVPQWLSSIY